MQMDGCMHVWTFTKLLKITFWKIILNQKSCMFDLLCSHLDCKCIIQWLLEKIITRFLFNNQEHYLVVCIPLYDHIVVQHSHTMTDNHCRSLDIDMPSYNWGLDILKNTLVNISSNVLVLHFVSIRHLITYNLNLIVHFVNDFVPCLAIGNHKYI